MAVERFTGHGSGFWGLGFMETKAILSFKGLGCRVYGDICSFWFSGLGFRV